ncbi:MAG: hypothetical protein Q9164_005101 [Protoblastenia rupestris]
MCVWRWFDGEGKGCPVCGVKVLGEKEEGVAVVEEVRVSKADECEGGSDSTGDDGSGVGVAAAEMVEEIEKSWSGLSIEGEGLSLMGAGAGHESSKGASGTDQEIIEGLGSESKEECGDASSSSQSDGFSVGDIVAYEARQVGSSGSESGSVAEYHDALTDVPYGYWHAPATFSSRHGGQRTKHFARAMTRVIKIFTKGRGG